MQEFVRAPMVTYGDQDDLLLADRSYDLDGTLGLGAAEFGQRALGRRWAEELEDDDGGEHDGGHRRADLRIVDRRAERETDGDACLRQGAEAEPRRLSAVMPESSEPPKPARNLPALRATM